ncbi:hypothetical protein FCM35_KLT09901 [Carex littledalei]|uniref:Uncharacterized protein n=1 Tax=Carex littledalei TaxID=544730 RepID=A0A833RHR1_9POAL|nr:hypothetical protein FCM35_KLT09901 [Carex littledalei]
MRLGIEYLTLNRCPVRFAALPRPIMPGSAVVVVPLPHRCSHRRLSAVSVRCNGGQHALRTCKNCKGQFDPALNHPSACRFHTAHFGGETRRKFESVYTGGTMNTPDSGKVYQYWHCCGSEDPFHPGCTSAPHASYDD